MAHLPAPRRRRTNRRPGYTQLCQSKQRRAACLRLLSARPSYIALIVLHHLRLLAHSSFYVPTSLYRFLLGLHCGLDHPLP